MAAETDKKDCCSTHFDPVKNYGPAPGSAGENFGMILKMTSAICIMG